MKTSRAIPYPAREAGLALLAGFAFLATAVAANLALAPPASGQVFSSTPYVAAPDPAVESLRARLDALEGDLRKATGRAEQLTYDLNQARKTAEEANAGRMKAEKAIDALTLRIEQLERLAGGDISSASGAASQSAEATVNLTGPAQLDDALTSKVDISQLPSDEEGLLREARNLLLAGDYPSAQGAFTSYLASYGKGENAGEAQYMLGESLLYQSDYNAAAAAYGKLLSDYPKSARGPDGLVKLARSMRLMNKKTQACSALALMPKQFPKASDSAKQLAATEKQRSGC